MQHLPPASTGYLVGSFAEVPSRSDNELAAFAAADLGAEVLDVEAPETVDVPWEAVFGRSDSAGVTAGGGLLDRASTYQVSFDPGRPGTLSVVAAVDGKEGSWIVRASTPADRPFSFRWRA